jgi:sugar lactone lactonase YvrE
MILKQHSKPIFSFCLTFLNAFLNASLNAFLIFCLGTLSTSSAILAHPQPEPLAVETLVEFDSVALETPESLVIDHDGNFYVSLAFTGEIRKITRDGTQSTHAMTPIGTPLEPCFGFQAILGALTIDENDNIYANVNSCDLENRGVWKVTPAGELSLIAPFPGEALINGIELVGQNLYIADSNLGLVWTVPVAGGMPEPWAVDPLLEPDLTVFAPGPNGIQFLHRTFYVANSSTAQIISIRLLHDGSAGQPRVHATLPFGCDDFALDVVGNIYCTTDPSNRLLRVSQDGSTEVLLDADDGLDGPTDATFGRRGRDRFNLYITNAAFPFFTVTNRPSLMKVRLNLPGAR